MKNKIMSLPCILALGAALVQPNWVMAQEEKPSGQEEKMSAQMALAKSIDEISAETVRTRAQLQAAVGALDALTKQTKGDLKPTYDNFAAEVEKTHTAADQTASRAVAMKDASMQYFGGWQQEIAGIMNESLRKTAQKRQDTVRRSYDRVVALLGEAGEKFKPFLSNLDDVQKMLANDITPGGVKAIRGVANDAKSNVERVRQSINNAITELDKMEKALSSKTTG